MPKVYISEDERYPYYEVVADDFMANTIEVSEENLARIQAVFKAFEEVQKELRRLYGAGD